MDEQNERGTDAAQKAASKHLYAALVKVAVDRIKTLDKPWHQLGEQRQREVIDGIASETEAAVRTAVTTIGAANYPVIRCKVDSVLFKDGVKAVLTTDGGPKERHQLADAQGQTIAVVVADADQFLDRAELPKAEKDQRPLALGGAAAAH